MCSSKVSSLLCCLSFMFLALVAPWISNLAANPVESEFAEGDEIVVLLRDGRSVRGRLSKTPLNDRLAIATESSGVVIQSDFLQSSIIDIRRASNKPSTVIHFERAGEFTRATNSAFEMPLVTQAVQSLQIVGSLSSPDIERRKRFLTLLVQPLDQNGLIVPVDGQIMITLAAPFDFDETNRRRAVPNNLTFRPIRWSRLVQRRDFGVDGLRLSLPLRDFATTGAGMESLKNSLPELQVRLSVPGLGRFSAVETVVPRRPLGLQILRERIVAPIGTNRRDR